MSENHTSLINALETLINTLSPVHERTFWVAFSGGLDSTVLLHCCQQFVRLHDLKLHAIHVNHHLSVHADAWVQHSQSVCRQLGIELVVKDIYIDTQRGESLEAQARERRYQAMAACLQPHDVLLTAHHQDDQAETLLLKLLRGTGTQGIGAMRTLRQLGQGYHLRPWLDCPRQQLHDYASRYQLSWINDESNADSRFDRNYLRHQVLPVLHERWPAATRMLARTAHNAQSDYQCLEALAEIDLADLDPREESLLDYNGCSIALSALLSLSPSRQVNVLRFWLRKAGLSIPDQAHLHRILYEVLPAGADRQPCVHWHDAEIRRYQQRLYASGPLKALEISEYLWPIQQQSRLTLEHGTLNSRQVTDAGIDGEALLQGSVSVRFRSGGELIRPQGARHTKKLKKMMQAAAIPEWLRGRMPLIYIDDRLAAVPGWWVTEDFRSKPGRPGFIIEWSSNTD